MSNPLVKREVVHETFEDYVTSSTLEDVYDYEIEEAQKSYKETGKCSHSLIKDEKGWLYDFRSCAICGKGLGTV